LFQCGNNSPALFDDQVNVNVRNRIDIQKFVIDFLTSPDFFPGFSSSITAFPPTDPEVMNAAEDLFQELQQVLPHDKEEPIEEWPAYPFLQLEIPLQQAEQIRQVKAESTQVRNETIQEACLISAADKYCEQLFGVPSFEKCTSLKNLVAMWQEAYPDSKSRWVEGLCSQILAGIKWKFPAPTWELMQSLSGFWCAPVLNRVRKIPSQQCLQFDIYFYKFNVDGNKQSFEIAMPSS
jgi:hypothetical protein